MRVAAIPDENPTELIRKHQPMVEYLTHQLGADVTYIPVTDYGAVVQALSAKQVDFAWLGGFTFVQAKVRAKAVPLVMREIDRSFKSAFIANAGSGIEKLDDLKGKKIAFGSKSSTSGHLMPRHFLLQGGVDPDRDFDGTPVFSGAHDATVRMVESGRVQAGAVNSQVWDRMLKNGEVDTAKVKVFWMTPGFADYVWASREDVDPKLRAKFKAAFLGLDGSKPAHRALLDLQGANKFVEASSADFDVVETVARKTGLLKD